MNKLVVLLQMKQILPLILFLFLHIDEDTLFSNVNFTKGKAYKKGIPVVFYGIGKTGETENLELKILEKKFSSRTSLEFIHNDKQYYFPIQDGNKHFFLDSLNEGDLIYINIVIFDKIDTFTNEYWTYIDKIILNR